MVINDHISIIAHRGASFSAPENTMSAIISAWNENSDAVEIDVHLSKDGRIVAMHDFTTERTANKSHEVSLTHSSVLRKLDISNDKGKEFPKEKIPFLEEVLKALPEGKKLFIEIKCGREIIPALTKILESYDKKSQVVIIGFDLNLISEFKSIMPEVKVYWLLKRRRLFPYSRRLIYQALAKGIDGLDGHYSGIKEKFIKETKEAGLEFYVWTVDDLLDAKKFQDWGVNGITTNHPGFLRKEFSPDSKHNNTKPEISML